jgi:hypothetical protein
MAPTLDDAEPMASTAETADGGSVVPVGLELLILALNLRLGNVA